MMPLLRDCAWGPPEPAQATEATQCQQAEIHRAEPQLTAAAIVGRLGEIDATFGARQQSIVQRLLRPLRRTAAETLVASAAVVPSPMPPVSPGAMDGSGHEGPNPSTAPTAVSAPRSRRSVVAASPSAG